MNFKRICSLAIIGVGATVWLYAFAANRKVTIPSNSEGLQLFNGWTSNVSYNATCYDSTGATAFTTNSTLSAKQSVSLIVAGAGLTCAGGTAFDTSQALNGMGGCSSIYTDYNSAMTSCPAGYNPCSITEYNTNRGSLTTDAFLADQAGTWSYSSDAGSTWTNNSTGKPRASYGSSELCALGAAGGGTQVSYCTSTEYYGSDAGPLCCGGSGAAVSCMVEVTSDGHLQSPQFKGGSPF